MHAIILSRAYLYLAKSRRNLHPLDSYHQPRRAFLPQMDQLESFFGFFEFALQSLYTNFLSLEQKLELEQEEGPVLERDMAFDTWIKEWACSTEQRLEQVLDALESPFESAYDTDEGGNLLLLSS